MTSGSEGVREGKYERVEKRTKREIQDPGGGTRGGGSQCKTMIGSRAATRACLAVGLTWHGHWGGKRVEEAGAKWGAASGHDGRVILLSCCQRRCPVSSFLPFSPIVLGCRPGDRVASPSKVQRASPSARVREPMGACISASRTRQVAGSIPVEPSQLPDYTHIQN